MPVLIHLLLVIAVVGVIAYLLGMLPMPPLFKQVLYIVAALIIIIYALRALGIAL